MNRFVNGRPLLAVYIGITISFILVKHSLRPYVLANSFHDVFNIFVLSYPNFCEAIIGSIITIIFLLLLKDLFINRVATSKLKDTTIYYFAVGFTAVFVTLQETKIHNLGGENIFDPYDLLFSMFGCSISLVILLKFKPSITPKN